MINRILLILLLVFSLSSCGILTGNNSSTIIKGARIDLPKPPNPIGIKGKEGIVPEKFEIVDPPLVAESFQYWRAYKDGAIIWKPKDWRSIDNYMKTSKNWIDLAQDRIKLHNEIFNDELKSVTEKDKKWYNFK
jgi:hypothetical protein